MKKILILFLLLSGIIMAQTDFPQINEAIKEGEFTKAEKMINEKLEEDGLSKTQELDLKFQLERMDRIRLDFTKTKQDILDYVKRYYPNIDDRQLTIWEDNATLEYKIIDGEKFYFNRGASNLFRLDPEAKAQKHKMEGFTKDKLDEFLEGYVPKVVNEVNETGKNLVMPVTFDIEYTLTVDADAVPGGETIKAWLPYPREGHGRQYEIELKNVNSKEYTIADNENMQRTLFMQKPAKKGEKTVFQYSLTYKTFNEWYKIDPAKVGEYDKVSDLYKEYTAERAPHIIFTDKIKELSDKIIGDETNPYLKAKKIYTWISDNIPWAGAREYSTIENISDYCITTGHGDCGIKTILFMTLARYNGIPVKWQSGWMLHPGEVNLHDWSEMYLEGYGWVPVDQSFGITESDNEDVRYYFLGGMDAYRMIVNDDYSRELFPAKSYPRSETVDFQRGEVEWRGGNIYFNEWDYHMEVKYSEGN